MLTSDDAGHRAFGGRVLHTVRHAMDPARLEHTIVDLLLRGEHPVLAVLRGHWNNGMLGTLELFTLTARDQTICPASRSSSDAHDILFGRTAVTGDPCPLTLHFSALLVSTTEHTRAAS